MSIQPTKPEHWPARAPFARSGSAMDIAGRPTRVVARDGAPGIVVDARVLAVRPELSDAEALVFDLALCSYEAAHRTKSDNAKLIEAINAVKDSLEGRAKKAEESGGVRLASDHIAELTGLTSTEAAAVIASLIARRLLLAEPDALGGTDGWRPVLPN